MTDIEMEDVVSDAISRVGYDPETRTLAIEFAGSGQTWHYTGFSADQWEVFNSNGSYGSYFHHYIKGRYPGQRVE